jgi:hypothetical protein
VEAQAVERLDNEARDVGGCENCECMGSWFLVRVRGNGELLELVVRAFWGRSGHSTGDVLEEQLFQGVVSGRVWELRDDYLACFGFDDG